MIQFKTYTVREVLLEDAKAINTLMIANKERFSTYFPQTLKQNLSFEASKKFTLKKVEQFKAKKEFLFIIKMNDDNQVLGLIYIKDLNWDKKQGEFAYCIDANFHGKGLISTAVERLSEYAFKDLGLETLQIIVYKNNIASVKVAKKCNFIWQKTLAKEFTPENGHPLDMELYELYK